MNIFGFVNKKKSINYKARSVGYEPTASRRTKTNINIRLSFRKILRHKIHITRKQYTNIFCLFSRT